MLFQQRAWAGLADGSITVTFRKWKRPQVIAGRSYRSPGGMLAVERVDVVVAADITDADARGAGFESAEALRDDNCFAPEEHLYRIEFHRGGDDPRDVLASDDALTEADRAELGKRLARLDRASSHGLWTMATLRCIEARPGVVARILAADLGRERDPFKLDVRKLKALGLTISLDEGYELSPRGQAYLDGLG